MLLSKSTNEVWHGILFEVCVKRDRMCFIDDDVVFFIFAFMSESESRDNVGWYGAVFSLKNPTPIKRRHNKQKYTRRIDKATSTETKTATQIEMWGRGCAGSWTGARAESGGNGQRLGCTQ